jgi:hypothetical protein
LRLLLSDALLFSILRDSLRIGRLRKKDGCRLFALLERWPGDESELL